MKRKYWVLLISLTVILTLDQYTKFKVQQRIPLHRSYPVIEGFFNLTHVRNTGGAFGFLAGKGTLGSLFFMVVSLTATAVILFLIYRLKEEERIFPLSLSLILSGALGNLIDRIRYGEVIDFLDFYLFTYHWPAFNIADSSITLGIGLMVVDLLIHDKKRLKQIS